jgi:hypothetical protein
VFVLGRNFYTRLYRQDDSTQAEHFVPLALLENIKLRLVTNTLAYYTKVSFSVVKSCITVTQVEIFVLGLEKQSKI